MSQVFYLKKGDTSPAIRYALTPVDTVLTGATVKFQMRVLGGPIVTDATATVVTATGTPTVQYNWTAPDTALAGRYQAEFRVVYADGSIESFPNFGFIQVIITEDVS